MQYTCFIPLLFLLQNVQAQTPSGASGTIDQVVVFLQGAQVIRSMPYTLTPGTEHNSN